MVRRRVLGLPSRGLNRMDDAGDVAGFGILDPAVGRPVIPWVEAVFFSGFLVVPALVPGYLTDFASRLLILAMFALSFDLVFGYAAMMSFGQAFFFGGAGYVVALLARDLEISSAPHEHAVFSKLSVRDNLAVGGQRRRHQALGEVLSLFPKLGERLGQAAGTLSGGERKMLAMARALLLKPRVLLLDEPTEGVWIGVIQEITSRLKQLVREIAVVLVEQHLELALEVADYAYVLDRGRVALEGTARAVRNDPRLMQILAP